MMKIFYKVPLILSTLFLLLNGAKAQVIFAENFDYPVGNLEAKNGGTGFSSEWSKANTNTATLIGADNKATILAGSIAPNGIGNRVQFCLDTGKSIRLDRVLPQTLNGAKGTTYWFGFWYRSTLDTNATLYGSAAQVCLMGPPNNPDAWSQRLQLGKHAIGNANVITAFSRGAGCTATAGGTGGINWGTGKTSKGTYYILTKIIKGDSTTTAGVVNDVIRMWALPAAPARESDLSVNGDASVIQTRVLRGDNTSFCTVDGITGLRIRVEGGGNSAFCAEFDEIRLGTTFASVVPTTSPVKDIAANFVHSKLTPNPAFDNAMLNLTIKQGGHGDVSVYDFSGKRLSTAAQGHFTEGERQVTIPTQNLAAGVYFVRIAVDGAVQTEKLIVMK